MKPRVYVETSIFSFYFDERMTPIIVANRMWTRAWWDERGQEYECVVGATVLAELRRGDLPHREKSHEMASKLPVVKPDLETERIIGIYIANRLMPADPVGDASHLALASVAGCEYLLTWNCRHLANASKFEHIENINRRLGLPVPRLVTPQQLLGRNEP